MQNSSHQTAERILQQRGYKNPAEMIYRVQDFIIRYGKTPLETIAKLVRENQLVCLGEFHNYEGRYMHSELIEVAAIHGVNVLFVEVYNNEQKAIDDYLRTGDFSQLPESCGGARASNLLPSNLPYLAMLAKARVLGMKIVAVDIKNAGSDTRDYHMAEAIQNYFTQYPSDRGIFVTGQLHLLPRLLWGRHKSASTLLKASLKEGVVTIGRAYIDINGQSEKLLNIWALMADISQPVIIPTQHSTLANFPDIDGQHPYFGNDFDYLFLYPFPKDEIAKEAVERDKLLQEKNLHPVNVLAAADKLNVSPLQAAEALVIGNLADKFERLQVLANQGDEVARIESKRLATELIELSQRYSQTYLAKE
jgi:hypothetical protein